MNNLCDAKTVSVSKIEQALREYFNRIDDLTVSDMLDYEDKQQKALQDTEKQINILIEKLRKIDTREKEVIRFYTSCDIEFENYRTMKKQLEDDKDFINNEIEKLKAMFNTEEESKICKADVITNFRKNWDNLSSIEKRQFLMKFIKKIIVINEPIEGKKLVA